MCGACLRDVNDFEPSTRTISPHLHSIACPPTRHTEKLSPQPHTPLAFGFVKTNSEEMWSSL